MVVSSAPVGSATCMKDRMRLSARATPGTERARYRFDSGTWCTKSRFGELREVTQRSAPKFRIVMVELSSSPTKSPACTSTSVTANATPDTVMRKRTLSWSSVFRPRSTMALVSLEITRLREHASHHGGRLLGIFGEGATAELERRGKPL